MDLEYPFDSNAAYALQLPIEDEIAAAMDRQALQGNFSFVNRRGLIGSRELWSVRSTRLAGSKNPKTSTTHIVLYTLLHTY